MFPRFWPVEEDSFFRSGQLSFEREKLLCVACSRGCAFAIQAAARHSWPGFRPVVVFVFVSPSQNFLRQVKKEISKPGCCLEFYMYACTCIYTYMYVCTILSMTSSALPRIWLWYVYVCMHVCMHVVCMYPFIGFFCVYVCTSIQSQIHTYVHVYKLPHLESVRTNRCRCDHLSAQTRVCAKQTKRVMWEFVNLSHRLRVGPVQNKFKSNESYELHVSLSVSHWGSSILCVNVKSSKSMMRVCLHGNSFKHVWFLIPSLSLSREYEPLPL